MSKSSTPIQLRIDAWLNVSCLYKTRTEAQRACTGGKISVNGERAKPHRKIKFGDLIVITTKTGKSKLVVRKIVKHNLPKSEANKLYEEILYLPNKQEAELQELLRRAGPLPGTREGTLRKRERRIRRQLKGF